MVKQYKPVADGTKRKKPTTVESVRNIERVDSLEPTQETFDKITDLASRGFSTRSIAYMLGVTAEVFQTFRDEHEEEVVAAIDLGRVIDETEITAMLRAAATSTRSSNFLTALQAYGKINFGWLGSSGANNGAKDLPRSISFTMIEPETEEDA